MQDITYNIGDRQITLRQSDRRHNYCRDEHIDVFEGDQLLTTADPWCVDEPPTAEQVAAYLEPRRQELQRLMTEHDITVGPDYEYDNEYAVLWGAESCPRWVAITHDETYSFFHLNDSFRGACASIASRLGDSTGGSPAGVVDLDTGETVDIAYHTLVWARDSSSDADYGAWGPEADLKRARRVHAEAEREFETTVLAVVSARIRDVYPTATALRYDGEENEDGLLHTYVREILDADGNVLDSQDDPSDRWEELIDEDVEPLLWEVSERDQSYYGEGKTLGLA